MKKIISALLAVIMVFSFSTVAFAAQTQDEIDNNIATKAMLDEIVAASVSSVYDEISDSISENLGKYIDSVVNDPELIKKYIVPAVANVIIKNFEKVGIVNEELNTAIVDLLNKFADDSNVVEIYSYFMSNEFVQAVRARTIKYAIDDAMAQIGISSDKAAAIEKISDHIWNAPKVTLAKNQPALKSDIGAAGLKAGFLIKQNLSYYDADVEIKGIFGTVKSVTVKGWNEATIKTYCLSYATANGAGNADKYVTNAKNLDYKKIFANALKNALKDEIAERLTAFIEKVKAEALEEIAETISELKAETLEELSEAIYEWTGKEVTFSPDATKEEILAILKENFCPVK